MDWHHRFSLVPGLPAVAAAAFLASCMAVASCAASDRSVSSAESAERGDLINRPDCWTRERSDEWYRCAAGIR
jgi:hypothetical protein